ncbi:MAG TPA: hypothetical protein VEB18_03565 [Candidatus Paceibacterota bacterium]|nr:hypothetical protein [Candidatus Paceibacterota bacterium]
MSNSLSFEGTLEVLSHCERKAHDPERTDIRVLCLGLPGTMRGVYGAGSAIALHEAGLTPGIDVFAGISTSAPIFGYTLSGQAEMGTGIYSEECVSGKFMGRMRVDTNYLASVFRDGHKALNQEAVRAARSAFYVAVTCAQTGEGAFIDAKTAPDMIDAIHASLAIPGMSSGPITINDRQYIDGVGAFPFPIREALELFQPTDVLILANAPGQIDTPMLTGAGWAYLLRGKDANGEDRYPEQVRRQYISSAERYNQSLYWLRNHKPCRFLILKSDHQVDLFERDAAKLRSAAERSRQFTHHLIDRARSPVSAL